MHTYLLIFKPELGMFSWATTVAQAEFSKWDSTGDRNPPSLQPALMPY